MADSHLFSCAQFTPGGIKSIFRALKRRRRFLPREPRRNPTVKSCATKKTTKYIIPANKQNLRASFGHSGSWDTDTAEIPLTYRWDTDTEADTETDEPIPIPMRKRYRWDTDEMPMRYRYRYPISIPISGITDTDTDVWYLKSVILIPGNDEIPMTCQSREMRSDNLFKLPLRASRRRPKRIFLDYIRVKREAINV